MKIFSWIDSFFNTTIKRRTMLLLAVLIWWMQQLGLLLYFLPHLTALNTYADLMNLLGTIRDFQSSLILKLALEIIQQGRFVPSEFFLAISPAQYFMLLCTGAAFTAISWKWRLSGLIWAGIGTLFMLICIFMGLSASSLQEVIGILKILGIGLEIWALILFGFAGWKIVVYLHLLISQRLAEKPAKAE